MLYEYLSVNAVFAISCGLLAWYHWDSPAHKTSNYLNIVAVVINVLVILVGMLLG